MLDLRREGLEWFFRLPLPNFGPKLEIDFDQLSFNAGQAPVENLEDLPARLKQLLDAMGIPELEQKALAGLSLQVDSSVVYKSFLNEMNKQGVIVERMDEAVRKYDWLKDYFGQLVRGHEHKFAALHNAFWSGGTLVRVPAGVKVKIPIHTFFIMQTPSTGQMEHTIIIAEPGSYVHYMEGCTAPVFSRASLHVGGVEVYVMEEAHVRFTSVQNWTDNIYNLPTKRAVVDRGGIMEWVSGTLGSRATMLYPTTILRGEGARAEILSVSFADQEKVLDTGANAIHVAPNTSSRIISKSVVKDRGVANFRGKVKATSAAKGARGFVRCDTLHLSRESKSETYPVLVAENDDVELSHEAAVGRVSEEKLFYIMSRGFSEEEATAILVNGFLSPVLKELPDEFAREFSKVLELSIKGM